MELSDQVCHQVEDDAVVSGSLRKLYTWESLHTTRIYFNSLQGMYVLSGFNIRSALEITFERLYERWDSVKDDTHDKVGSFPSPWSWSSGGSSSNVNWAITNDVLSFQRLVCRSTLLMNHTFLSLNNNDNMSFHFMSAYYPQKWSHRCNFAQEACDFAQQADSVSYLVLRIWSSECTR